MSYALFGIQDVGAALIGNEISPPSLLDVWMLFLHEKSTRNKRKLNKILLMEYFIVSMQNCN